MAIAGFVVPKSVVNPTTPFNLNRNVPKNMVVPTYFPKNQSLKNDKT